METTITLNEQQSDLLLFEIGLVLDNENISNSTRAILNQIVDKLTQK